MFIVEKDNKIILADTDSEKLQTTLAFMPDCAGCEIVETDRPIEILDGAYVFADTEEYKARIDEETRVARIAELKTELDSTDYKIIKCSECQLVGLELPYDVLTLHAERQALREEINRLESI